MASVWSEATVEALRALAADGLSASQAASQFNGMTRNAAVGIAFRREFHFLGNKGGPDHPAKSRKTKMPHVRSTPFREPFQCEGTIEWLGIVSVPPHGGQLSLDELRYSSCRFIERDVMDPNHRYCGQTTIPDKSWCPHHATIVYQPREERRR